MTATCDGSRPRPCLVFHEVGETEIVIHGVRHGARDPETMPPKGWSTRPDSSALTSHPLDTPPTRPPDTPLDTSRPPCDRAAMPDHPSLRAEALLGARRSLPVLVAVMPFAAVFGAVAAERWSGAEALMASALVYAGASQYVMLDLHGQGVPAWAILLTVVAVNFRHVLYSAAIGRRMGAFGPAQKALAFFFLVDPQFAEGERRAREARLTPAFWFGYAATIYTLWMTANAAGVVFGALIEDPARWGLDLVLPLYFLALVVAMRGANRYGGIVLVSAATALAAHGWLGTPWHIMTGGVAGMLYAALATHRSRPEGAAAPEGAATTRGAT